MGACKMGNDPMAVVDDRLRVRGIAGLRVADASVFPTMAVGNINAPVIMVAEKAADMMGRRGGGETKFQSLGNHHIFLRKSLILRGLLRISL